MSKTRTAGDGMEACESNVEPSQKEVNKLNVKPVKKDVLRLVQVYPSNHFRPDQKKSHINMKTPKFVPYEPYPGAVKPIVPSNKNKGHRKSKNNMDINTLISQMSQMDTKLNEFKPRSKTSFSFEKIAIDNEETSAEKAKMQLKIDKLVNENETLQEQLKQQVQVNKELKTMLVASMGEDLETQVQSLNEDKKHLADALVNSAQHLSTHQEQTEWLAGQCEVWRSKFLASSLMVEELANWKKILNERVLYLQQAIRQLLDERCRVRDMSLCTYKNLISLHVKWLEDLAISEYMGNSKIYNQSIGSINLNSMTPQTTNILELCSVNLKLSENISSSIEKRDVSHIVNLSMLTDAEQFAESVMAMPMDLNRINEEPVNALVHHAYSSSGNTTRPIASCVHCKGKVELL